MKNITIDLINAYLRYHNAVKAFEEQTGCSVCISDYIQLYVGDTNAGQELVKALGINVDKMDRKDGYWEFTFTYQAVKFLWLEPVEELEAK